MTRLMTVARGQLFAAILLVVLPASNALAYPQAGDENLKPFVNYESPHVHPLDLTPDRRTLLAVNTADNRLEVFDVSGRGGIPVNIGSIPVGLEPVSVRVQTNNLAWVVNQLSDTVSVVDLNLLNVVSTLHTEDEPADVVFAGSDRAFVTGAQASKVMVFDTANLAAPPVVLDLDGEEPRAMAVSEDGSKVYVAMFESGNKTTILGVHGQRRIVDNVDGPYSGQNPPPNEGTEFFPSINPDLPVVAPNMGLIIKKQPDGTWQDENDADWTEFVSGSLASRSNREQGWDVMDNDIAVIDAATLSVSYLTGMLNSVMALAVNPASGKPTAVGLNATNEIRFEPNLKGRFVTVDLAIGDEANPSAPIITDLNPHLDYSDQQVAEQSDVATASQAIRDESIGDPRAIVWNGNGSRGVIAGMGSNNLLIVNASGVRVGAPILVGEGPTGLVLIRNRIYVLNKFDASISLVSLKTRAETSRVAFFDPTPAEIKTGRKHLYNTHLTSGLGHIACASCHIDGRADRIAWDLGNPAGEMAPFGTNCSYGLEGPNACKDFHPMKGPMLTQTLQDIVGKEPHHWRGDKTGLEGFSGAFTGLQGDDTEPSAADMQEFEDFLATLFFPPNPFRNFDNSLPTNLALPGHVATGRFELDGGDSLPAGNAQAGMEVFRTRPQHTAGPGDVATCVVCHTFPTGQGADMIWNGVAYEPIEIGPDGEHHLMTSAMTMAGERRTFKVPQLRNLYKRAGFDTEKTLSRAGFGFLHDGGETLSNFFTRFPEMLSDQEVADFIAFMLSFSGSDLPEGSVNDILRPPGPPSQDSHAAVGTQLTVTEDNRLSVEVIARLADMTALADAGKVGLVAKGLREGSRGYTYVGAGDFQSDHLGELINTDDLRLGSTIGKAMTFTVVPYGTQTRIGIDRDLDGILDNDDAELAAGGSINALTLAAKSEPAKFKAIKQAGASSH